MRILLAVILALGLGFLSSCTPPAGVVAKASKLYIDDPNASTITVMRKSQLTGAGARVTISLDAEVIANLAPGDRVEFQAQPGEHYIAATLTCINRERSVRFNANAKKKHYFYYSMGGGYTEFNLEELTAADGEKELAKNKYKLLTASK
jgi:hypothetical protein